MKFLVELQVADPETNEAVEVDRDLVAEWIEDRIETFIAPVPGRLKVCVCIGVRVSAYTGDKARWETGK